jgi:hypothetical protein
MKIAQLSCIAVALAIAGIGEIVIERTLSGAANTAAEPEITASPPNSPAIPAMTDAAAEPEVTGSLPSSLVFFAMPEATAEREVTASLPSSLALAAMPDAAFPGEPLLSAKVEVDIPLAQPAKLDADDSSPENYSSPESYSSPQNYSADQAPPKPDFPYLGYYVYSEIPLDPKPADIVLAALKDVPVGTPLEEIKRASDAFGLDFNFMKSVARIESDFDPKQRTGSYFGLFQLSHYEFAKYGSGDILSPRDNAIAAAYKFVSEAVQFEWVAHKKPTFSDLYLIHQQGWQGAAEHVAHPDQIAWKSMCETDEGMDKGEKWCKRAIWGNTLPSIKHVWKSVENLTSGAFVAMWRERVESLYARYSEATVAETKH